MLFQTNIPEQPFKKWIWEDRENKRLLILSAIVIALQFALFKFLYPFPNFMPPDSNSYVSAAFENQSVNVWAIGYSKFLRLVSSFTSSDVALVIIQYVLLQASLLYLLYTLRYLLLPGKWVFRVLILCNILNPLVPHISNFVSSDGLFTTLSLIWFTQLLWILYKPNARLIGWHAFILLFAFMVRYNALYYPVISIIIITLTGLRTKIKLLGAGLIILLLGAFIGRSMQQYYTITHTVQYSGFSGWLMAANALYGYAYAKPDEVEKVPVKFRELHALVNRHMDSIRHLTPRPDEEVGIYYVWDLKSPLRVYMNHKYPFDSTTTFFMNWARVAPLYAAYGRYLIKQHPWLFMQHYMWPNFIKYYAPPTKFMGFYNLGEPYVAPIVARWFGWRDNKIAARDKQPNIWITEAFPVLIAIINLVFILSFIGFVCLGGLRKCSPLSRRILYWTLFIWIANMGFSVFTAPIELRYQLFPMIITFVFAVVIIESMVREFAPETIIQRTEYMPTPELRI